MNESISPTDSDFHAAAAMAVADQHLRQAYQHATGIALEKRAHRLQSIPEWESLREQARQIKRDTLDHLDQYLKELEKNIMARGIKVIWAKDSKEACHYVLEVARQAQAKTIVKAKSMVSEEIGLNHFLEQNLMSVFETDLGEYIVQLAGETPSHLTAPALHKTRQDIGRLFARKLGIAYTDDPAQLTAAARRILRGIFLKADLGISGINFAAADTGTLVIIENEGNGRYCTTRPKIHIALMGIEKVIPHLTDLPLFLRLLPASATGQKLTSYVSLIHSPKQSKDPDGPAEVHLILLDNGRTRLLADPRLRQSLSCIRCGACLNVCPVYQRIGGHSYGTVYPGPIGAVISPTLLGFEKAGNLPFASSLCGACSDICPVKIDLHHLLLWQRYQALQQATDWKIESWMAKLFECGAEDPLLYRFGSWLVRRFLAFRPSQTLPIPGWSNSRDFPAPAAKSFKELWQKMEQK
jgi:L-lactate dehydrogenase complex protein LldF